MNYAGTICTHCSDGCKTTLSVRNGQIIRANNRDRSGINGEFLCAKGRFGYDFVHSPERLQSPLIRKDGKLEPASWSEALSVVAAKFSDVKARGGKFGVVGSTHTTNEENYYLQKFVRKGLGTSNIDHQRTGDVATLLDALSGHENALAVVGDLYTAKSVLVLASDLAQQHPLLAFQLRANYRHNRGAVYTVTPGPVRERDYAAKSLIAAAGTELDALNGLAEDLKRHENLVILFGPSIKGDAVRKLVAFGDSLGIPVKYICLLSDSNSRGALDMGLLPELGPGYRSVRDTGLQPGLALPEMLKSRDLAAFWVVGANPLESAALAAENCFVVVQDLFLTETAQRADVVLPSASAYEKSGTVTNASGEVQRLKPGPKVMGVKSDLEIIGLIGKEMGLELGIWSPDKVFEEIRREVRGYNVALPVIATGGAAPTLPVNGPVPADSRPELIQDNADTRFTSGTLSRYSKVLNSVMEAPGALYKP
jgi:NADH-quinone oxidoreductase subunit G